MMGDSPKVYREQLAAKLGCDLQEIDMFEINEAFASQQLQSAAILAWIWTKSISMAEASPLVILSARQDASSQ